MSEQQPRARHTGTGMRALAHPTRLEILRILGTGPANVKTLAERVGEPANCVSFHLRTLEKYGHVVHIPSPPEATKRESWWEACNLEVKMEDITDPIEGPEVVRGIAAAMTTMYTRRAAAAAEALARMADDSHLADQSSLGNALTTLYLSQAEAHELGKELFAVMHKWEEHSHPHDADTVEYELAFDIIPHFSRSS